jgi:hypothetical protein
VFAETPPVLALSASISPLRVQVVSISILPIPP